MNIQFKSYALNEWFVGILWVKIIFSSIALVKTCIGQMDNQPDVWFYLGILLMMMAIYGAYLLVNAKKFGFYLIVATNLCSSIIAYVQYLNVTDDYDGFVSNHYLTGAWSGVAQIVLLLLLMLLPKNGANVYQVLWDGAKRDVRDE